MHHGCHSQETSCTSCTSCTRLGAGSARSAGKKVQMTTIRLFLQTIKKKGELFGGSPAFSYLCPQIIKYDELATTDK
jgi:hypothetical protein